MIEEVEPIEEQIEEPVEEVQTPAEPKSIRESLSEALAQSKEEGPAETEPKIKAERVRGEDGKFAPKTEKPKAAFKDASHEAPVEIASSAPQSFSGAVKAKWAQLPPDVQADLVKRDQDFHKELTRHDEERTFGRKVNEIVNPYMATIRAEGSDAPQAIASLLNMAHVLRVGTPQQKSDLLLRTAQTFGVDLRQVTQQGQQQVHPMLQQVMQEQQNLKAQLAHEATLKKQQEDAGIQQQIKTFSSEAGHEHFETVKAHMASLLSSNLAKDLQDAYDQAVYANPQTRSTLLAANEAVVKEKRLAEQKARAEAAKKAGSSLKGSGVAANRNGQIIQRDLRSELKAQFDAQREG